MEQIIVHKKDGTSYPLMRKEPLSIIESASQHMALMGEDYLQLSVKATADLNISYGDKIIIYGREYFLRSEPTVQRLADNLFSYQLQFMGVLYELMKSQYRNADKEGRSSSSSFDLTGKLVDFIRLIPLNTSRSFGSLWSFDEVSCPETDVKTLSFSKENCLSALQRIVKEYEQEFYIQQSDGKRIIKVGKNNTKINPPGGSAYFEYGKGKGLYDLKLQKTDDKTIITRLWAEGGDKNLPSNYRGYSKRLQLPLGEIGDENKRYVQDEALAATLGDIIEDTEFFDDIYPTRTGIVSAVSEKDLLSFYDDSIDFDLNERDKEGNTKWLIAGVSAKIIFTKGSLAGQEFEVSSYNHKEKKFKIVEFSDSRGLKFPNPDSEAFRILKGDNYKITDINLPETYVASAENKLLEAAVKKLEDRKQPRAQYTQTFDKMYFDKHMPKGAVGNIFLPGNYVPVKDDKLRIEKDIQIQKVTRNLLDKYDYTLELSDINTVSIISDTISSVLEHEKIIENNKLKDPNKARRGWRTTEELRNMVYDPDGYFDTENIKPNSIDTNMLAVGAKSQQFVLEGVTLEANYQGNANVFNATKGKLVHLAIAETPITWELSGMEYTLTDKEGYYAFAKCSKAAPIGVFIVSQTRFMVEPDEDVNNYYFQIGIISSEQDGFRDFTSTYGFTRINGNTITTGRIATSNGESFLDLDNNKFRIGDSNSSIDWNNSKENQLTLSNVKLVSGSGDVSGIGVFRGEYQADATYYKDDQVTYIGSTYRYINDEPAKGILPIEKTHWLVVASKGDSPTLVYRGVYDKDKVYYGTSSRVDAVKYGDIYYVAKTEAGEFINTPPSDTKYWSNFGAYFESVSTHLLLAEQAQIGDWYHSGGKIVSTLGSGSKITLDARNANIEIDSDRSGGSNSVVNLRSKLSLDANNGVIKAESKDYYAGTYGNSYVSPTGVFANTAATRVSVPHSSYFGVYDHRAAIVGNANGDLYGNGSSQDRQTQRYLVAGVYGCAHNYSYAPAFGGVFWDLKAYGMILSIREVWSSGYYIGRYDSLVINHVSGYGNCANVYLPTDGISGRVIHIMQQSTAFTRVWALGGQTIADGEYNYSYFDIPVRYTAVFTLYRYEPWSSEYWAVRLYSSKR